MLQPDEIARINQLGEEVIKVFERVEEKIGREHLAFVNGDDLNQMAAAVADVSARIADEEAAGKLSFLLRRCTVIWVVKKKL